MNIVGQACVDDRLLYIFRFLFVTLFLSVLLFLKMLLDPGCKLLFDFEYHVCSNQFTVGTE